MLGSHPKHCDMPPSMAPLMIYTIVLQITLFNLLQTHMKYCENVSLDISGEMLAVR